MGNYTATAESLSNTNYKLPAEVTKASRIAAIPPPRVSTLPLTYSLLPLTSPLPLRLVPLAKA